MERRSPSITTARGRAADITAQSAEGDAETSDEVGDGAVVGDRFGVFIYPKIPRSGQHQPEQEVRVSLPTDLPLLRARMGHCRISTQRAVRRHDQDDDEEGDLGEDDEIVDEGLSW